jgi:hypothetical protein
MAQVMKRRSLVNSGKRRRRNTYATYGSVGKRTKSGKKRMSAKQIKYFGTARQRAALRASSHRKRRSNPKNYGTKFGRHWSRYSPRAGERKASNRRYAATANSGKRRRRRKARKNVGAIYSIGLAGLLGGNPGRKRKYSKKRSGTKTMARRRRRRSNAGTRRRRTTRARRVYVHRRRRRATSNPSSYRRRRRSRVANRHHRRRRNPGISGALSGTTGMFKNALSVIGGAVGSRYATQLALGASNTGAIGYLANAIAALALGWAAGKFMKSPQVGAMVTLGGFTGLALRMLSDLTPIGQYVNLSLSGAGKGGDVGIGLITDTTFYVPTVFQNGSMTNAMVPNQLTQLMAAGSVGSKAGVGSYRRRRAA